MTIRPVTRIAAALSLASGIAVGSAAAQDSRSFKLELNALETAGEACRITLVATNELGTDISRVAYEVALFDANGMVDRVTVLDLKDIGNGRTRVRQFGIPGGGCDRYSRIIINDSKACDGAGLAATDCLSALKTENRTKIAFSG